ncbi:hypothetical protein B0J14DRAFT_5714 [Halenospora varia]|nr:hypothetical protein B0J14DRAFT_5714 [Halenospora varia]
MQMLIMLLYRAFTNVISDNQWSAIGLMLLGSLARFRGVLNEVGREIGLEEETIEEDKIEDISGAQEDPMKVDLGEVIDRNSLRKPGAGGGVASQNQEEDAEVKKKEKKKRKEAVSDEQKAETVESTSTPAKRPKKKRKKGGDAFDDLFDSLM